MIWEAAGAEAVAAVRAWLKSGRWPDALALHRVPVRRYVRKQVEARGAGGALCQLERADEVACESVGGPEPPPGGLAPEVLAQVRAELAHERGTHPWRKAWSVKQQREQHAGQAPAASTALAA